MHYRVRDGLSWCSGDGRVVFMDLPADRYFRLRPEDERAFRDWVQSGAAPQEDPGGLIAAGVLVPCDAPHPPLAMTAIALPTVDLAEQDDERARASDIMRGLVAQRRAAIAVRRGELSRLIAGIRTGHRPDSASVGNADHVASRIAAAFAAPPLCFGKSGQCLPRALAAFALCRRGGIVPTLVFGVRLEPFAAHCWLQIGATMIVGDLDQARMFMPILVVP